MNPKLLRMYSDILGEQAATPQPPPSQRDIAAGMTKQAQLVQARTPKPAAPKPASTSQNIKAAGAAFQSQQPAQTTPGGGPSNAAQLAAKLGQTAPATAPAAPASNPNAPNQIDTSKQPAAPTGAGGGFQGGGYGSVGASTSAEPAKAVPAGLAAATTGAGFTDPSNKPAPAPTGVFSGQGDLTGGAGRPVPTPTASADQKTYGGGYDPSKAQMSYSGGQATSTPDFQPVAGTSNAVSRTQDKIAADTKKGPLGGMLPANFEESQEELEEETDESLEEELEEAFNDMLRLSGIQLNEKAPPGAKAERMVKHIKKGYAKDGKITPKEKSIAYATAWKAKKAGKLDEGLNLMLDEGGQALDHIANRFKYEVKMFMRTGIMDNDLYEALADYYVARGEIPYGVVKGKPGFPDQTQWVEKRFAADMNNSMNEAPVYEVADDGTLNELARLAGLSESRVDECGDMGTDMEDRLNVSTNMSSDGTKSVNISAQGEKAEELLSMLKLAGMGGSDRPSMVMIDRDEEMIEREEVPVPDDGNVEGPPKQFVDVDEERETEYANTPEEEYETVAAITRQGNDLNREKKQFANMPKAGDNPMATDYMLDEELSALLDSILVKEADPQRPKGDTGIADIYTAAKGQPPSPDEGPINYPKKIQPQQPKTTEPSMKNMPLPKDAPEPRMKNMPLPKGQEPRTKPM